VRLAGVGRGCKGLEADKVVVTLVLDDTRASGEAPGDTNGMRRDEGEAGTSRAALESAGEATGLGQGVYSPKVNISPPRCFLHATDITKDTAPPPPHNRIPHANALIQKVNTSLLMPSGRLP
jgi:hypothetical protein